MMFEDFGMRLPSVGAALVATVCLTLAACDIGDSGSGGARFRVLNASPDYTSLDLYVDDDVRISGAGYETITGYEEIAPDNYEIKFKRGGVSSTLYGFDDTLGKGTHVTYVALGSTGSFAVISLDEDKDEADRDKTYVSVVDAAVDGGSLDVYLTDETASLDDTAADFSGLTAGSSTSQVEFDSGTYRLRVTGAGNKSDLRLDVSGITLSSEGVLALVLTNTVGGTLVNCFVVPQQEAATFHRNDKARVRAVAGTGKGTTVTTSLGGVSLLSAATGTTLGAYKLVSSGTHTPDITVDGARAATDDVTLGAGGDYTLLTYKDSASTVSTLLTDNNRLPSSSYSKIRLLNAMSGFGAPLTLSVDFFPVAEVIPLGESSAGVQVDPISDGQVDVARSSTGETVYSRVNVELAARSVYTMAIFGDSAASVGVLRKDR